MNEEPKSNESLPWGITRVPYEVVEHNGKKWRVCSECGHESELKEETDDYLVITNTDGTVAYDSRIPGSKFPGTNPT
jgi:hypothetical protein